MMNTKQKLLDYDLLKKDYLKVTATNAALLEALQSMHYLALAGATGTKDKYTTLRRIQVLAAEAIRKATE